MDLSLVLTTYKDDFHLRRVLNELSLVDFSKYLVEIILLDASDFNKNDAINALGKNSSLLRFYSIPGLSRTKSLNKIFELSTGRLISRIDARTSIKPDYFEKIFQLNNSVNAEVVGGVMLPIGSSHMQKIIASLMKHPFCFGGSKFRDKNFNGYVDSVYLGTFDRKFLSENSLYFDEIHPNISEDSDLNYRISKSGGKLFMDSSIRVEHYPREILKEFFRLCFNYGVGRGIFIIKHKRLLAIRQAIPILSLFLAILLFFLGFYKLLIALTIFYAILIMRFSITLGNLKDTLYNFIGFTGSHFFWTIGVLASPLKYSLNLMKKND